jgi:hypothetical protein
LLSHLSNAASERPKRGLIPIWSNQIANPEIVGWTIVDPRSGARPSRVQTQEGYIGFKIGMYGQNDLFGDINKMNSIYWIDKTLAKLPDIIILNFNYKRSHILILSAMIPMYYIFSFPLKIFLIILFTACTAIYPWMI